MTLDNTLRDAWEIGKRKCGFLVLFGLVSSIVGSLSHRSGDTNSYKALAKILQGDMQGAKVFQEMAKNNPITSTEVILFILSILLSFYVSLVLYRYVKKIVDDEDANIKELISSSAKIYGMFFVKCFLYAILVIVGFFLCILPGIYLMVRLVFVSYIAANEPELTISETISKSMKLTKDRFWQLFGYGIVACLIVLAGFLLCCVGYLFTMPLAVVFMGVVYKELVNETYIPESIENNEMQ